MKHFNLKMTGVITFSLLSISAFSQNWRVGGNNAAQMGPPGNPPILGTMAGNNQPLNMFTNGIQRMHVNQNTGLTDGFIGIGNNFTNPQSLLHLNNSLNEEAWLQITNSNNRTGLKLGTVNENLFGYVESAGYLKWHNITPFIIQTGFSPIERIRISSLGYPNPDPFNISGDLTRVAISEDGSDHIEVIRSLLHLGYNTGAALSNNTLNDGWRDWMDIGTFTNNGRENMYVGLKQENPGISSFIPIASSRYDAIINWGDNEAVPSDGRYNNLRFVYTTPETNTTNQPHTAWNGLETMRIDPTVATTLSAPNFGMVGIGDFSPGSLNDGTLDAKLDIDGDLRIRTVTEDNNLTQILVIDPADHNRVHWRDISSIGGGSTGGVVTANNGLRIFPANSGNVRMGGTLLENTNIDMGSFNMNFTNQGRFYIGGTGNSKLVVRNDATPWVNIAMFNSSNGSNRLRIADNGQAVFDVENSGNQAVLFNATVSGAGWNTNGNFVTTASSGAANAGGIVGVSATTNGNTVAPHYAFSSTPHNYLGNNYGYYTLIRDNGGYMGGSNYGVLAWVSDGENNYGASFNARSGRTANYGVDIVAGTYGSDPDQDNAINYGVRASATGGNTTYGGRFSATGGSNKNYGIYVTVSGPPSGTTPPSGPNYAGYFAGDVYISGTFGPSDIMLKDNLNEINNASNIINQLQPKTFDYKQADFPSMNLSSGLQYGLIAQDVETILPDLITEVTQPAELDSLGNVVTPEINFKGLEYQQLIPILIAGFKEQQSELDTKDSLIDNLQSEINYIKECLLNARICEEGNRTINQNPTTENNQKRIELINTNSIILDQNLPNPFAESTVINYNIPTEVMEAKLLFYDLNGRIIKELMIEERGESKLTVYGTNLKTGVYAYSLIADGKLIATKKMVKK